MIIEVVKTNNCVKKQKINDDNDNDNDNNNNN